LKVLPTITSFIALVESDKFGVKAAEEEEEWYPDNFSN
jgi:hypothetical protein